MLIRMFFLNSFVNRSSGCAPAFPRHQHAAAVKGSSSYKNNAFSLEKGSFSVEKVLFSFNKNPFSFENGLLSFKNGPFSFEKGWFSFKKDFSSVEKVTFSLKKDSFSFEKDLFFFEKLSFFIEKARGFITQFTGWLLLGTDSLRVSIKAAPALQLLWWAPCREPDIRHVFSIRYYRARDGPVGAVSSALRHGVRRASV